MRCAIIIPARYGSTRFPGKPLAMIAGRTMLDRVVSIARAAALHPGTEVYVTTDDVRIAEHAQALGVACLMTPSECPSGTDRVASACAMLEHAPDLVLNLQGDAPLTPPSFLSSMIASFQVAPCDVLTPVVQLDWPALDGFREAKRATPFSGTTAVFHPVTGRALWFSKTILPAIRKEEALRAASPLSPVWRHIGLYGYRREMLDVLATLPESHYEALEGLEQLRFLEAGYEVRCVPVSYDGREGMSGVDSPEDIARAEALIARDGELIP